VNTTPLRAATASLHASWRDATRVERSCYLLAAALGVSGVVHLGVLVASGGSWSGPLSWRKPATFGVSFGLTLATITWVSSFVPRLRRRPAFLTVFALACLVEVLVITVQAWRGRTSHFGVVGEGGGLVAAGAAAGAVAIVVTMAVATVSTWRPMPGVAPSMRLALRVGFASLMVALALGVLMLARGMVISRSADGGVAAAFAFSGGIKPGHAATMHGVLVLPALAWLLSFADRTEGFRLTVVRVASLGYALFAGVVVVEVLAAVDPFDVAAAPVAGTVLAVGGAALLVAAGAAAVRSLRPGDAPRDAPPPRRTPPGPPGRATA
jgi:hypothetical protein